MTDLVVGLGEIGAPLKRLLESRGFEVDGYDEIKGKSNDYIQITEKYDYIHICIPYNEDFEKNILFWKQFGKVIIHSTVKPGTSKRLGVIYAPVNGVHARMLDDMTRYVKWYSGPPNNDIQKRFLVTRNMEDSTKLETTKIIVDTTYYGWLIAFRKYVDDNYDVDWSFADQIQTYLGNRPIMYNDHKPIGGHCVVQNLDLIEDDLFNSVIGRYR